MATSGTYTYTVTANTLINGALRLVNAIDPEGGAATANQTSNALEALEMMVKGWQTEGLQLWERKYAAIFFQKGQSVYNFDLSPTVNASDRACLCTPLGTGFVKTTIPTGALAGASTVTVDSVTSSYNYYGTTEISILDNWYIGMELSDGTMFWTTVNGNPAGEVVTLDAVVPAAGVDEDAVVYSYSSPLWKPLRLLDCFIRLSTGNDTPVEIITKDHYNTFGYKASQGTPTQVHCAPMRQSSHFYFYPTPMEVTQYAIIEFQSPIEDIGVVGNNMDLPSEWIEALKYNLAYRIAPEYGVTNQKFLQIEKLATNTFEKLDGWDREVGSVFMQPDTARR